MFSKGFFPSPRVLNSNHQRFPPHRNNSLFVEALNLIVKDGIHRSFSHQCPAHTLSLLISDFFLLYFISGLSIIECICIDFVWCDPIWRRRREVRSVWAFVLIEWIWAHSFPCLFRNEECEEKIILFEICWWLKEQQQLENDFLDHRHSFSSCFSKEKYWLASKSMCNILF